MMNKDEDGVVGNGKYQWWGLKNRGVAQLGRGGNKWQYKKGGEQQCM